MRNTCVLWLALSVLGGCDKSEKGAAASSAAPVEGPGAAIPPSTLPPPPVEPPPPPEESPVDKILKAQTLAEAVEFARSGMTDVADEHSVGTLLLTVWAAANLKWQDVSLAKNETSFALIKKDVDEARGKRMCASGRLIQISKQELGTDKVYAGLLYTNGDDLLSFFAVGSTGALVERSKARFCGVVTGVYDYSNSGGGTGHAVDMVGMFDLPANKSAANKAP